MEQYSLTEILLDRLMNETGMGPAGDLVERMQRTPPAVLRNLRSRDAECIGIAASLPLDMAGALAEVLQNSRGDDGRFDTERANAFMAEQAGASDAEGDDDQDEEEDDFDGPGFLMHTAHAALGLPTECESCAAWVTAQIEGDADAEGHHNPESMLQAVYAAHPEAVDDWEPQIAWRIAQNAGNVFGGRAGFSAMHEVVAHAGSVPGVTREGLAQAHGIQHVGMGRCEDAAEVHALHVALVALRGDGGVKARIEAAERSAVDDAVAMAGIPAAVAVGLVAQQVEVGLASTPTPPPARRLPRGGRPRR